MAKTTSIEELGERIERLVQEHIAASRRVAQEAVERAFASGGGVRAKSPRPAKAQSGGRRRAPTEIAALGERLHRAVCDHPGETMVVLAAAVGSSARGLHRPMSLLKQAGRVRSAGSRHLTRYFPMTNGKAASA